MSVINIYTKLENSRPILSRGAVVFSISALADATCQYLHNRKTNQKHNFFRTIRHGIAIGISVPIFHFQLVYAMPYLFPGMALKAIFKRYFYGIFVTAPIASSNYVVSQDVLSGKSFSEVKAFYKKKWYESIGYNWRFWPIVNFIIILVPHFRMLIMPFADFAWAYFLSSLQNV